MKMDLITYCLLSLSKICFIQEIYNYIFRDLQVFYDIIDFDWLLYLVLVYYKLKSFKYVLKVFKVYKLLIY